MQAVHEVADNELRWIETSRWGSYELRLDDTVLGLLKFRRGWVGGDADVELDGHRWTFRRRGFWRQRVTVLTQDLPEPIATFHEGFSGGRLEFREGRSLRMKTDFWHRHWVWEEHDQVLVRLRLWRQSLLKRPMCRVIVEPAGRKNTYLPLLVSLGFYLITVWSQSGGGDGG